MLSIENQSMDFANLDALFVLVTKMLCVYAFILNNKTLSAGVILFPGLFIEVMVQSKKNLLEKLPICSSTVNVVQRRQEVKGITSRSIDHLAMTTSTEASRRCAAVIAPPLLELGKTCGSRQSGSRRAMAP